MLVLGLVLVITTMGMGALLSGVVQRRAVELSNDESEARSYAYAATEWAWYSLPQIDWRATYKNAVATAPTTFSRGTISFKLVDEADSDLTNDALQPVRLYAYGRVGSAARVYSVVMNPAGPAVDSLTPAVYAGDDLTVSGNPWVIGAPAACADLATINALCTLNGSLQCGSYLNLGTVTGARSSGVAARTLPLAGVWTTYANQATTINFASIAAGTMQGKLLTAASNPYGTPNAAGVYLITVPAGSNLSITNCRIAATLLVRLGTGANLKLTGAYNWGPATPTMPALIVQATSASATVAISGSLSPLSEAAAGANFNPASSPYAGVSNSTSLDTYPAMLRGLVYVQGTTASATLDDNLYLVGTAIADDDWTLNSCRVENDPFILANPPSGFINPNRIEADLSTWRQEPDN